MWHHCERHSHRPGRPATHDNHCSLWPYLRLNLGSSLLDGNRGHFEVILAERWLESRRNQELTLSTIRHISFLNSSWFAIQGTKKSKRKLKQGMQSCKAGLCWWKDGVGVGGKGCHAMPCHGSTILCHSMPCLAMAPSPARHLGQGVIFVTHVHAPRARPEN